MKISYSFHLYAEISKTQLSKYLHQGGDEGAKNLFWMLTEYNYTTDESSIDLENLVNIMSGNKTCAKQCYQPMLCLLID